MTKKAFDSMSGADAKMVRSICRKHTRRLVKAIRADDLKSKKILSEKGILTVEPEASEISKFNEISRRSAEALAGKLYSAELLKDVQQILSTLRAKKE
jgi:TRAP-type C4-dicarboxylate transport system substrate-binding protein